MSDTLLVYVSYVILALGIISWMGWHLLRDGRIFLNDVFREQADTATYVSRLLVTGFLVFTVGYALLLLDIDPEATALSALQSSLTQLGILLLSLGAMHSVNMLVLLQMRRRAVKRAAARRTDTPVRRSRLPER